jgi:hypothetical protein
VNYRLAHFEALANAVAGIALSQTLLWIFGVEFREAIALNAAMIGVSYARNFVLRILFSRLEMTGLQSFCFRNQTSEM